MFERLAKDLDHFRRVAMSFALHLRETQVALVLRGDLEAKKAMTPRCVEEMKKLLDADVENQRGKGRVVEMREFFARDPEKFVREKLVPTEKTTHERGVFSITTR
jgi:hypothetical protein